MILVYIYIYIYIYIYTIDLVIPILLIFLIAGLPVNFRFNVNEEQIKDTIKKRFLRKRSKVARMLDLFPLFSQSQ